MVPPKKDGMPQGCFGVAKTMIFMPCCDARKSHCVSEVCKGEKIQGFCLKIQGTYFKIYGLYFEISALCFFRCAEAHKKSPEKGIFPGVLRHASRQWCGRIWK